MRTPTKKQCPGCKQQKPFYAGEVCYDCENKLRDYPSMKATLDQLTAGNIQRYSYGHRMALPMACYHAPSRQQMAEALSKVVQAAFPTEAVEPGTLDDAWKQRRAGGFSKPDGFFEVVHRDEDACDFISSVPSGFHSALFNFLRVTGQVMRECNAEGRVQGQNLLFQLNDGSLSLDDFNNQLVRAERGERR